MNAGPRPPGESEGGLTHVSEILGPAYNCRDPMYDPPYRGPFQDRFAAHASNRLRPAVDFDDGVEVPTPWGRLEIDFRIKWGDQRVGVECDVEHSGDDWRDAVVLGSEAVDAIYLLRGSDVIRHPEDILYLMSRRDPDLFSDRGRHNLSILASEEVERRTHMLRDRGATIVHYEPNRRSITHLVLRRRHLPVAGRADDFEHGHLAELYDFAKKFGPAPLDDVRAAFYEQQDAA